MNQIHITRDGQQFGPFTLDQTRDYMANGQLLATDLAWFEGASDWMPLSSVPGLARTPPPPPRATVPPPPPRTPSASVGVPAIGEPAKAKTNPVVTGCAVIAGCMGLLGIIAAIGMLAESSPPKPKTSAETQKYEWAVGGTFGITRTIYLHPAALNDREFLTGLVTHLVARGSTAQLMFFDDRSTASEWPMSDRAMMHWRAAYNFNPNTRHERFVLIEITNPRASPPDFREISVPIKRR